MSDPLLFALSAAAELGARVAAERGIWLAEHEEREFPDGEHKARPLEEVRGRDVYVLQSLYGGGERRTDEKLIRVLFFIGALRDAEAARVTVVTPYLCYARKERRTKPYDPVTTRYVAQLFEAVGTDRLVVLDVHDLAALQNAFRRPTVHLEARHILAPRLASLLAGEPVTVLSPDAGGYKRAERFRRLLEGRIGSPVGMGFMEKHRSGDQVRSGLLVGEFARRTVLIVDDLVAGGGTLASAAHACRAAGAERVYAAVTHGLFAPGAVETLGSAPIDRLLVTDSVPLGEAASGWPALEVVPIAPLVAEAIRRLHTGRSLIELGETYDA